ncbi:MAG: ArnT family glycosyltransferase, partial [Hyphomonadaceae bacterium]
MNAPPIKSPARAMLAIVLALLVVRVGALLASPLELHFDEAQYWHWSRALDWGYFSKPPLIAWVIAATTGVFGNAEWAVRLAAPFCHAAGAFALFALARRIYGPVAGLWAGALWLTMPAVWLSSAIMSTDALVMPLWSAALYCLWRLIETRAWIWAILLGAALGLGALAKYAMLYFPLCAAFAALIGRDARQALLSKYGAAAAAIAALILAPNLYWNATHEFQTLQHTAANANVGAD